MRRPMPNRASRAASFYRAGTARRSPRVRSLDCRRSLYWRCRQAMPYSMVYGRPVIEPLCSSRCRSSCACNGANRIGARQEASGRAFRPAGCDGGTRNADHNAGPRLAEKPSSRGETTAAARRTPAHCPSWQQRLCTASATAAADPVPALGDCSLPAAADQQPERADHGI
jgi:hypothetical protein